MARKQSDLEASFLNYWNILCPVRYRAEIVPEYQFHPTRKWRFDYALPNFKIGIELDGGAFSGGRHVRGAGFEKDLEKMNYAATLGWRVFRYTGSMLRKDPSGCIDLILRLVGIL